MYYIIGVLRDEQKNILEDKTMLEEMRKVSEANEKFLKESEKAKILRDRIVDQIVTICPLLDDKDVEKLVNREQSYNDQIREAIKAFREYCELKNAFKEKYDVELRFT